MTVTEEDQPRKRVKVSITQDDKWLCAEPNSPWSSTCCDTSVVMPNGCWGHIDDAGIIYLRDTRGSFYKNEFEPGNHRFLYCLPYNPNKVWEKRIKQKLDAGAEAYQGGNASDYLEVRVFTVCNARDHYLGQFVAVQMHTKPKPHVVLARLAQQDICVADKYVRRQTPSRSASEAKHLDVIKRLCQPPWLVRHEPECALKFNVDLYVNGKQNPWASGQYTVDYIACSGSRRICFESKDCRDAVTEEALEKCRFLRDHSMCRVVLVADHDENMVFIDFGDPATPSANRGETWLSERELADIF